MSEIENLHIKELRIDNYKSLKHTSIELQSGLNIIIGKNGAGKSNLLEFIYNYSTRYIFSNLSKRTEKYNINNFLVSFEYLLNDTLNYFSYSIEKTKNANTNLENDSNFVYEVTFNVKINSEPVLTNEIYKIYNSVTLAHIGNNEIISNQIDFYTDWDRIHITYSLPERDFWLSSPSRLTIDEDFMNVAETSRFSFFAKTDYHIEVAFLDLLSQIVRDDTNLLKETLLFFLNNYFENSGINEALQNYSPIQSIRVSSNINIFKKDDLIIVENLYVEFLVNDDWLPWSYLSDGTKRLFYLISECVALDNGIILIEEPELGIHPHQFYKVLDFLQEQAQTKQVIISTHSPMALDILKPDELDRITIAKYDKGTKFLKLDEVQKEKAKRYMEEVGELSYYWLHSDLEND